jgi:hypothetical protein
MICLISAASDLVLRFTVEQLRQKARYFMDAAKLIVIDPGREASNSNGLHAGSHPDANQITNRVTMLSHHERSQSMLMQAPHSSYAKRRN